MEREQKRLNETLLYMSRDNPNFNTRSLIIVLVTVSAVLFFLGISMNNGMLAIVLAIAGVWLPYEYIAFKSYQLKREIDDDIGFCLSTFVNTLDAENSIRTAIVKSKDNAPARLQGVIDMFIRNTGDLNYSVEEAIALMKEQVDSPYWRELCDNLAIISRDHDMKSLLPALSGRLSDERSLELEWDNILDTQLRTYITNVAMIVGLVLLLRFSIEEVYWYLIHTQVGKGLLVSVSIALTLSTVYVLRTLKPLHLIKKR